MFARQIYNLKVICPFTKICKFYIFVEIKTNNILCYLNSHNFKLNQLSTQVIEMVNGKKTSLMIKS